MTDWDNLWVENWAQIRERFEAWWRHDGLILHVTAPADHPRLPIPSPAPIFWDRAGIDPDYPLTGDEPVSLETAWLSPERRVRLAAIEMARTFYGGDAFPYFDTHIGPGSLGMFLGVGVELAYDTVWYHPVIDDPDAAPPLAFDPQQEWVRKHQALIEAGLDASDGRFLVGMPDLIENVDVVAALRGTQPFMIDLIERPAWVEQKVHEVNHAFFAAFDWFFRLIEDPWGGNAFSAFKIWGPGKTAKIQCDLGALISPRMFRQFVVPGLTEQCNWLDYSLFHLDGTQAMVHLDALLEIDALDGIEWTPQAGLPQGGDPMWYDLYRRILEGGKRVQAIFVAPDEVIPLLNAIGTRGVYLMVEAESETQARELVKAVEAYR